LEIVRDGARQGCLSDTIGALLVFVDVWRRSRRERVPFGGALRRELDDVEAQLTDEERDAVGRAVAGGTPDRWWAALLRWLVVGGFVVALAATARRLRQRFRRS